jgi:aldose 1-epimerase
MSQINAYDIANQHGDTLSIINFGARLISWHTLVNNESRNIVLAYKSLEDYLSDPSYLGAIVGPFANRIGGARCNISGKEITLTPNEGENQLHGGDNALANQFWLCQHHSAQSLILTCTLKDGFNGYPGDIDVSVKYEITETSELIISMTVNTDKVTIAGPTAHPYFNLNSEHGSTKHNLKIYSDHYTPVNNFGIPTGEITKVEGTKYDFRIAKPVSCSTNKNPLDHNFLTSLSDTSITHDCRKQATLESEDKQLALHASSNYPAIQVYTGMHLQTPFTQYQGVCLEPQFCPDSPNQDNFPFHTTQPGTPLSTIIRYSLSK